MKVVLDASALLAWLHDEPGAARVDCTLHEAQISAVNWTEVVQRARARSVPVTGLRRDVEALGVSVVAFDATMAEVAAALHGTTRTAGLSLGDRACLALARIVDATVLTADRAWVAIDLEIPIELIR